MTNKILKGHCNICKTDIDLEGKTEEDRIQEMDDHSEDDHKKVGWTVKADPEDGKDAFTWKGDGTQRDWYILERGF